jgi:hypothetical protein
MGRPTKPIVLADDERDKLQQWERRPKTSLRLALRARIVLGCAAGLENRQVASPTVHNGPDSVQVARTVSPGATGGLGR